MINIKNKIVKKGFLFFFLLLSVIVSCSKKEKSDNKSETENSKYKRIIVMDPAVVEMFYLLNSEDKIVGIAKLQRSKIWPEEKTEKLESVGTFTNVSVEKVLSLKPDLVIASAFYVPQGFEEVLKSNNIELKKVGANSIDEVFTNFQEIGKMLGKEKEAEKIIAEKKEKLENIKKLETKEKKGVFILSSAPMRVFGKGTLPDSIMRLLNIQNISDNMPGNSPILTPEFLIKENPDVILTLVKNPEEIVKANPQIKDVSAIKNRKFIVLDSNQVLRGSPRIVDHIAEVYEKTEKN
ncbi:ABC transporter substrate-binding protein [Pseudoleptotrichia goodfellowii]|uniref:ABC-type cobalamin/Fe3+-siderophores transportsystems, periplasmic component n=1 Tax=Pseudoleptotrichia goodfellowii TaxID=157692 RepID=A0A510JEJ0_9FUSO|nr:ABC transporter substrate-binding protein [Pseudoleptotrichia goodfellowii]BBM36821.1 ABC-type cobalamin/Fe3+-siderophores transportsystems, periplasmic component [Pseudoleptotrichia goodfellowii]